MLLSLSSRQKLVVEDGPLYWNNTRRNIQHHPTDSFVTWLIHNNNKKKIPSENFQNTTMKVSIYCYTMVADKTFPKSDSQSDQHHIFFSLSHKWTGLLKIPSLTTTTLKCFNRIHIHMQGPDWIFALIPHTNYPFSHHFCTQVGYACS